MKSTLCALAIIATCLPLLADAAEPQHINISGEFIYGTNPDEGTMLKICPDKASRGLDPFLAMHECFVARNISDFSEEFGNRIGARSLKDVDFDCYYEGTGLFQVSSFKSHKEDQTEMGGDVVTIADAIVMGSGKLKVTKNECQSE